MPSATGTAGKTPGETFSRALQLHSAGRLREAAEIYQAILAAGGSLAADARINLGAILDEGGRHEEALDHYREALALRGEEPVVLNNMGNTLMRLGRFAEAADSFRRALSRAPECQEARLGLGAALQRDGDVFGAIDSFRKVLEHHPDSAEAHWNLALALLMCGDFREGWREYQWRWRRDSFTSPRRQFSEPLWDGSPLAGRRILVHGEQGLGDTIQFMRYLPLVAAAGGVVLAECQSPSLRPLLESIPEVSAVLVMGEALPAFDLQIPLLSLPYLFGTTLENLPNLPYLGPDRQRLNAWHQRLGLPHGLRVGIVWAGKPNPDPFRSCTFNDLAPLADIPGVTLYSLQMGEQSLASLQRKGQQAPGALAAMPRVADLTDQIVDFGDTAALVSILDLVISVDTSVAHLAGALGKPVWLLLPKAGDYRWMLRREDSPWYPTMRIFRQERQGEWGSVVERVCAELRQAAWPLLEQVSLREAFNGWRVYQCGTYLADQGRYREATARFTKAAQLLPGNWEPHYTLAAALQSMGRVAEARESLQTAIGMRGDLAILHEALGITAQMLGDLDGAIASYQRALELDAGLVKSRFNLATAYRERGRFEGALTEFAEVVRISPDHADAHWNLAILLLLTGDFASGWREFAWRFKKGGGAPEPRWQDHPRWDGSPLARRTILLYAEQGLGDTLHFIRYATLVAGRGGNVLVEVQSPSLVAIVSGVAGVSAVLVKGETPPPFDCQASLLDLPGIFGTEVGTIPAAVPYLHRDAARAAKAGRAVARDGSFRVGIVWGGNPAHNSDAKRSIPLERLAPLAEIPGVTLYSLQLREGAEVAARELPLGLKDLSHAIRDFSDTAALAAELDLVITVDTSMAHLCGGLGLPVWVLIPFIPDWRWLLGRNDSPWYPTMRLFRQQSPGDWEGVVLRVKDALAAAASPRDAKSLADEHKKRGLSLSEAGRFLDAAGEFELALAANPADIELFNNLGCALDGAGRHDEAVHSYRRAISLDPDFMAPHYNIGNSLRSLGRAAEAVESYRRALLLEPTLPQGWHNLALALQDMKRLDEALEALERAVTLRPDYLEARHNLGELHHQLEDFEGAATCFKDVLARNPRYLPSWNGLGIVFQVQYRLEEAMECYENALSIDPGYLHALNNLGSVCKSLGMTDRAVACYRRVIALDPDYADAHWNLALVQLLLGQYEEGWRGYEWRFRKVDPIAMRNFRQPVWDGSPLDGRVILLHSEQGFGDTIQFARYATVLARMGGVVLVECQSAAVAPVVTTVPGVAQVLVRGDALPEFDVHASIMSLPYLCRTSLATIPCEIPYVAADPGLVDSWGARIGGDGFKAGIVWAGRKSYKDDGKRSLNLDLFGALAGIPGLRLYSLQMGDGAEQIASPPQGLELADLGSGIKNFGDTAAIIANLDLVISADTAVAHLAGALGKDVWVLLPTGCDWRWLLQRSDSPWYPTARLFRQSRRGDWGGVLERIAQELRGICAERLNEVIAGGPPGAPAG